MQHANLEARIGPRAHARRRLQQRAFAPTGGGGDGGGKNNWLAGAKGTLASTHDGEHYQMATSRPTDANLWTLFCVGRQVGWAAGEGGVLLSTIDGGSTWTPRATGASVTLRAVAFADPAAGIVVGDGATVLRSSDGGVTWKAGVLTGVAGDTTLYAAAIATRSLGGVGRRRRRDRALDRRGRDLEPRSPA